MLSQLVLVSSPIIILIDEGFNAVVFLPDDCAQMEISRVAVTIPDSFHSRLLKLQSSNLVKDNIQLFP